MLKVEKVSVNNDFSIVCLFNNGIKKQIDIPSVLLNNDKYRDNILNRTIFYQVKIGSFGELFWENAAKMKNENGEYVPCAYDMSPEFLFEKGIQIV